MKTTCAFLFSFQILAVCWMSWNCLGDSWYLIKLNMKLWHPKILDYKSISLLQKEWWYIWETLSTVLNNYEHLCLDKKKSINFKTLNLFLMLWPNNIIAQQSASQDFQWIVKLYKNKPKMAYSRDLPKMARQQCGIMDWNCIDT